MVTTRRNSDDDVPNFEAMIAAAVANALPNLTAALRTQITNDIRNGAESSGGSGGGGDATPQGIHVWIERFNKLKPLAFRSASHSPAEARRLDYAYGEVVFQVMGLSRQFKTSYFPTSEQQRYEREYGSIYQLDQREFREIHERFTRIVNTEYTNVAQVAAAARNIELLHESGNSNKRDRDGNRIQNRGQGQQENKGRHDQDRSSWQITPIPTCSTLVVIHGHGMVGSQRATLNCYASARTVIFGNVPPTLNLLSMVPQHRLIPLLKLKELKGAVQEMLENVLYKTHIFTWGAPVLFVKKKDGIKSLVELKYREHQPVSSRLALPHYPADEKGLKTLPSGSVVISEYTVKHTKKGWVVFSDATCVTGSLHDLERIGCELCVTRLLMVYWASMRIESNLMLQIKEAQRDDGELWAIVQNVEDGKHTEYSVNDDGVVWFEDRLCVPNDQDEIFMDFVTGLPTTQKRHDAIWVVVDQLTKFAHFLPIRKNYGISKLAEIFRQEIVRLHGTPTSIMSDRDPKFTSLVLFWKDLQKAWGTRLKFSTQAFHPLNRMDHQKRFKGVGNIIKRKEVTIQLLEDMLWLVLWNGHVVGMNICAWWSLPTLKSLHASNTKAAPFELLYDSSPDMSFPRNQILSDRQERVMRNKDIPFVKILWKNHPSVRLPGDRRVYAATLSSFLCLVRDPKVYVSFLKGLQKALREKPRLKFSTAFHPQTDGQSERTIQLGRYVRLIEITNEKVAVAKEKLKEARSRQKSYADKHRRDLEFQVGDLVHLDHEDLEQLDEFDLEEMDLKWQVAMISMRLKKFYKKTGRRLQFDAKEPVGFDKTKVECFNFHNTGHFAREFRLKGNQESRRRDAGNTGYRAKDNERRPGKQEEHKALVTLDGEGVDWTGHAEDEQENFALMAYSNSGSDTEVKSCSKECVESYAKLKKLYDEQREQLGDASIEIQAYTQALKKVEAQLVTHQKNQLWYEEKIRFMKIDLDDKTDVLTYHKKLLAEAVKEKEELKTKVENFQSSSKGLSKLLNSQMCTRDESGLGYGNQIHEGVLSYEKEVLESVFDSRSSDVEDSLVYDRFANVEGMHAVPPPMTGNYMPSGPDREVDDSMFTYGLKQSKTSESDTQTSNFDSCESNSSVETLESVPELVVVEPKVCGVNLGFVFCSGAGEREWDGMMNSGVGCLGGKVRIYQKSQENRQKRANTDTRNGRAQKKPRTQSQSQEKSTLKRAQGVTITDCHAGNPCVHICDPTAKANDPIIEGMDSRDCQELVTDFRPRTFLRVL
ncbi:ribonuclease H-like domain-containing protein [Tanacetum coccineum]